MKILIIEDEYDLVNILKKGFLKKGYAVDTATDGEEGVELYKINQYDAIILDLNLPIMDGLEVLAAIRAQDKTQRILILSARSAIEDRVIGLDMGANDYLPKPFDFSELDARVRSLLRQVVVQHDTVLNCGVVYLDTKSKQVMVDRQEVPLPPREYAVLEYLILHAGIVVSAETLIEHVWDSDASFFTDTVKVHISNLRKKLKDVCGKECIATVRGQGYLISEENCRL